MENLCTNEIISKAYKQALITKALIENDTWIYQDELSSNHLDIYKRPLKDLYDNSIMLIKSEIHNNESMNLFELEKVELEISNTLGISLDNSGRVTTIPFCIEAIIVDLRKCAYKKYCTIKDIRTVIECVQTWKNPIKNICKFVDILDKLNILYNKAIVAIQKYGTHQIALNAFDLEIKNITSEMKDCLDTVIDHDEVKADFKEIGATGYTKLNREYEKFRLFYNRLASSYQVIRSLTDLL